MFSLVVPFLINSLEEFFGLGSGIVILVSFQMVSLDAPPLPPNVGRYVA